MTLDKKTFLQKVIEQVKEKEARKSIERELEYHIIQAKQAWKDKGLTEEEAEQRAINEMGSPITLGVEMNKLYRKGVDWLLLSLFIVLLFLGILPVLSSATYLDNKLVSSIIGIVVAIVLMLVDYRKFMNFGAVFYCIGVFILLAITVIPNVVVNGVAFIQIGPISIKSIMAVPCFLLAWAAFFHRMEFKYRTFAILFLLSCFLFYSTQDTIATVFIYIVTVFSMLFFSKWKRWKIYSTIGGSMLLLLFIVVHFYMSGQLYQVSRILAFLTPEKYAEQGGWIYLYLEEVWSSISWIGDNGGKQLLTDKLTDTVFIQLSTQYGYIMAVLMVFLFTGVIIKMVSTLLYVKDTYAKLLLMGCITLYSIQVIYNIAMCFGLVPIISISLPFISYGIIPTLFNSFLIGIVLSIFRRKKYKMTCN
ncbi:FtsW/RodA/SpoVE family cell cycle protein [Bacillus sp. B1-b2]|nr:FtsW/RodA/SpoVE family cell cycle protein [Bacillus sp. B1-b2]